MLYWTRVCFWWFWDVESFEYFCNQWQMLAQDRVKCNLERRKVYLSSVRAGLRKSRIRSWVHFGLSAKLGPSSPLSCQSLESGIHCDDVLWLVHAGQCCSLIGRQGLRCEYDMTGESDSILWHHHSSLMENIKFERQRKRLFSFLHFYDGSNRQDIR